MSDETERDVTALTEAMGLGQEGERRRYARRILASDWYADREAQIRRLRDAIAQRDATIADTEALNRRNADEIRRLRREGSGA